MNDTINLSWELALEPRQWILDLGFTTGDIRYHGPGDRFRCYSKSVDGRLVEIDHDHSHGNLSFYVNGDRRIQIPSTRIDEPDYTRKFILDFCEYASGFPLLTVPAGPVPVTRQSFWRRLLS